MALERIWNNIQEKIGIRLPLEKEIEINRRHQEIVNRDERRQQLAEALAFSDACFSETQYVLGFSDEDPHPNHAIQFDSKHPLPKFVKEEYPLVLKNQKEETKN